MNKNTNKEFSEIIFFNYFPTLENGGTPPEPPVEDLPRPRKPERPKQKSLVPLILVLSAVLGVMLIAYGYVQNTGFTFNKSERAAVECADLPEGGVMCRRPTNG